eukprot:snap_masked-scaffold_2-processed-gene-2.18-mRNA-1 protein AED:1.00 eAED:1.00 QI:0/0/0/0/1/1/2/0/688
MKKVGLFLTLLAIVPARELKLWNFSRSGSLQVKNRNLDLVDDKSVINLHSSVVDLERVLKESKHIILELPDGESASCKLSYGNRAVPSVLQEKYSKLSFFSGYCGDEEQIDIVFNSEDEDSFSATLSSMRRNFYVDSVGKGSEQYLLYEAGKAKRDIANSLSRPFEDIVLENDDYSSMKRRNLRNGVDEVNSFVDDLEKKVKSGETRRKTQGNPTAYVYKIAILTSPQFSKNQGSTRASVFAALVTIMVRVNSIFSREFGAFFQFVENADKGICLPLALESGDRELFCSYAPNTHRELVSITAGILRALGVAFESYDIGFGISTEFGGAAYYPALCTDRKAGGASGFEGEGLDPFSIDVLSHELGHMFFGAHTFRDCAGPDFNVMPEGAVEPGGGSSLLSYPNICGGNNIQGAFDPYYNNGQLVPMYDYMLSVAEDGVCGAEYAVLEPEVILSTEVSMPAECTVPVGNSFQLKPSGFSGEGFYSWDRIDTGYEDFDSTFQGRFRSWKPSKSVSRFFPNLYFQSFPEEDQQKVEALPSFARNMTFRFAERTVYNTFRGAPELDLGLIGQFQTMDIDIFFDDTIEPLLIDGTSLGHNISAQEDIIIEYIAHPAVETVEFYAALNTFNQVEVFDYEIDNVELHWIHVGRGVDGVAVINMPKSLIGTTALMARVGNENCFYFDAVMDLEVAS